MEFLNFSDPKAVAEYEAFMESSPLGNFMQSIEWSRVKRGYGWRCEAVLSRNFDGTLAGTVLVLIKKFPFPLKSFLYAPWGPVCDLRNETVLRDLLSGVWKLAGKYRNFEAGRPLPYSLSSGYENHPMPQQLYPAHSGKKRRRDFCIL